jgi:hypothetical protein
VVLLDFDCDAEEVAALFVCCTETLAVCGEAGDELIEPKTPKEAAQAVGAAGAAGVVGVAPVPV